MKYLDRVFAAGGRNLVKVSSGSHAGGSTLMASGPILTAVHAIELGQRLRAHRTALGLTTNAVGKATGLGGNNVSTMEIAKRRLTSAGLTRLAEHYDLAPNEVAELESLRTQTERHQWWNDYESIFSDEFVRFLGLEAGAASIREYVAETVPGLLQTADYARAMIRGGTTYIRPVDVGPRVESRLARQTRLEGPEPVDYAVVLGPAAIRMEVGGRAVLRRQLEHLAELVERDEERLRIRVMPFSAGAHSMIGSAVSILSFDSRWVPDHAWVDSITSTAGLIDRRSTLLELTASFNEVLEQAMDRDATLATLHKVRTEMEI
ncbi:helix-turn-helix domain-containing protein [Actinosynnema sp. CS-041913]|uniref:helix-turn-helix domain-containing protein n=1 Tax=Actinosynnema sp. CS-041913 TaxID=3239917 RepID=UPI003D914CC7